MASSYEEMLIKPPKSVRGRKTLNRICEAAEELFGEKGYYETSITDITTRANVGTGTFYVYFESKLRLYEYLLKQYSHRIRKYISMAVSGCGTRREAEETGIRAWLAFITEHKYVFNITWESMFVEKRLFDEYYTNFAASYIRQLDIAKKKGEIKDIDLEVLSFAIMGITNFVGLHWVVFKEEKNFDYVVDQVMKILDGMFAEN